MYEYLEELDQMNWSARGNVLNEYLRNTSIGTTVNPFCVAPFRRHAAHAGVTGAKNNEGFARTGKANVNGKRPLVSLKRG